jgi:hypothetical protein
MESTRVMRAAGVAGILAAVLILAGEYYSTKGMPAKGADAASWTRWVDAEEGPIETGVYLLLIPGLLLFLVMLGALMSVLPRNRMSTEVSTWGGLAFFVCMALSGTLASTTASTIGYFDGFEDPQAVATLTGISAGFHLTVVAVWALALTMVGTAVGLRSAGLLSGRLRTAAFVLAGVTVATSVLGAGMLPALVWIVAVSIGLLSHSSARAATVDQHTAPVPS